MDTSFSVLLFSSLNSLVVLFQLALAAGMPWGVASMGGKYPGKYPPAMRRVALLNAFLLLFINLLVFEFANFTSYLPEAWGDNGIWVVLVFMALGTFMNSITPSKIERIWAPVAFIQFLCCLYLLWLS